MTERKRVQKHFKNPSLTMQAFKDECDLRKTLQRFSEDPEGLHKLLAVQGARYEDVSDIPDYRTAIEQVNVANAKFMALPVELRKRFNHDPAQFLDFCSNEANLDEMRKLGLAKPLEKAAEGQVAQVTK